MTDRSAYARTECSTAVARHREHVGRGGQEAERGVRPRAPCSRARQHVDRGRHPDVGGAVGVDVVAEHQPAVAAPASQSATARQRRRAGRRRPAGRVGRRRRRRPAAAAVPARCAGRRAPAPDRRPRQVDRDHPGAPAQQRRQRSHLGAGAEHGDGLVRRAGASPGCPAPRATASAADGSTTPAASSRRAGAAARRRAAGRRGTAPTAPARPRPLPLTSTVPSGRRRRRARPACRSRAVAGPHPVVQRGQPGGGDVECGRSRTRSPASTSRRKCAQVAAPPVRSPARRPARRPRRPGAARPPPPPGRAHRCCDARRRTPGTPRRAARRYSSPSLRGRTGPASGTLSQ